MLRFYEGHGCEVCGNSEIKRYRVSWEALDKAGLTGTTEYSNFELAPTPLKLRAI